MKILILNGSPRANGNTIKLINAFTKGAEGAGHEVERVDVCKLHIYGCTGCEYCHSNGHEECVQKDDMQIIYDLMRKTEMIVIASPIYYHGMTGQIKCVIDRFYSVMYKRKIESLKKSALILCSADPDVYEGSIYLYKEEFDAFMKLEDMGIFTACYSELETNKKMEELYRFGESL